MTFHTTEALIFSDRLAADYLVHFQSQNTAATVVIISKTSQKRSKFWQFPPRVRSCIGSFFKALQFVWGACSAGSTRCQVVGCDAVILKSNAVQPTAALLNLSASNPPESKQQAALASV